jgi:hypothetical protein
MIVALVFFGWKAYSYVRDLESRNTRLFTDLIGQKQAFKELSDHAAELAIQYDNSVQMQTLLQTKFAAEKAQLEGRIKVLSTATVAIKQDPRETSKSDLVSNGTKPQYVVNEIKFKDGPPIGYVLIFDDGKVVSQVYDHELDVNTAVSRDEDTGKYTVISKVNYILKATPKVPQDWTDKEFPLQVTGGTAIIDPTEKNQLAPRIQWWAPHLNGGLSFGAGAGGGFFRPTVDLSLAGYGATKNDLDWKFLHIGFDSDSQFKNPGAHIIPFSYRFWPAVLSNTYAGPGLGMSSQGINAQLNLNLTF